MSLETVTAHISEKLSMAAFLNACIHLDFGDDGSIVIDATQNPPTLSHDVPDDVDTVLSCTLDTFKAIAKGEQDPTMAFMMGKLKVTGNMGVAMKLNSFLED